MRSAVPGLRPEEGKAEFRDKYLVIMVITMFPMVQKPDNSRKGYSAVI